jgi:hypothetical protein
MYFAAWWIIGALTFWLLGFETQGRSIKEIDSACTGRCPHRPGRCSRPPATEWSLCQSQVSYSDGRATRHRNVGIVSGSHATCMGLSPVKGLFAWLGS